MLESKFLVAEIILDNKILCPSMSSVRISGKQQQNSYSNNRIDDTPQSLNWLDEPNNNTDLLTHAKCFKILRIRIYLANTEEHFF